MERRATSCEWPTPRLLFETPRIGASEPTRIAVIADIHYTTTAEKGTSKQLDRAPARFRAACARLEDDRFDALVCLGDLAHGGSEPAFRRVAARLTGFDPPTHAVPGNHDTAGSVTRRGFAAPFASGDPPYRVRVGGVELLGLATANGRIAESTLDWVAAHLTAERPTLVALHHPLPDTIARLEAACRHAETVKPPVANGAALADCLAESSSTLVLSAHLHTPLVTDAPDRTELSVVPGCTYPQGYLRVTVSPDGCQVHFVPTLSPAALDAARRRRAACSADAAALTEAARRTLQTSPVVETA